MKSSRTTMSDRFALFVGCGIVGAGTGLIVGLPLFFFTNGVAISAFGVGAGKICFYYLPLTLGAVCALCGMISPDRTADTIGNIWRGIVAFFQAI